MSEIDQALIIAVRAEAKADTAHSLVEKVLDLVATKMDAKFDTLDKKIELMRSENTHQHAEANRQREEQVGKVLKEVAEISKDLAVHKQEAEAYTDQKTSDINSRITKMLYWGLGVIGTGTVGGIGVDKLIGLF